jgi:2,4-dienoyl-CoA reductase-like NADH-dependent reductase (Old Yellow Enzyme family)
MEYDKSTLSGPPISHPNTTKTHGHGHVRITANSVSTTPLAQPITFPFSGRTAKNRFLKAPMTERLCYWPSDDSAPIDTRGVPSPEYRHLYQRWGEGEIGIIVSGNTMVAYDAVEAFGNPILCDDHDGRVAKYKEVVDVAKKHGSLIIAQISHPGRQGNKFLNPNPVSASDVHLTIKWAGNEFAKPRPLNVEEIGEMVRKWGETAYLCWKAGYDGVQGLYPCPQRIYQPEAHRFREVSRICCVDMKQSTAPTATS